MTPIVIEPAGVNHVVGMFIVDEVFYLFAILFFILAVLFIIDLGFDIEECRAPVSTTLATVAL